MPDKDLSQLIDEYEGGVGLTTPLSEELPEEVTIEDVDPRINTFYNNLLKTPQFEGIKIRETLRTPKQALRNEQKAKAGIISKGTRYSKHIFGGAMDIDFPTEAQYLAAGKMAETMGLKWGGVNDMGHIEVPETYKELKQGLPKSKTVEEALAEVPDDIFDTPSQEVPLNAPGAPITNEIPQEAPRPLVTGPMGTQIEEPTAGDVGGDIATVASMLLGGPAANTLKSLGIKGASKIAPMLGKSKAVQGLMELFGQSASGATVGGSIAAAKGNLEDVGTSATIGAAIPVALKPIAGLIKIGANKLGDMALGKWDVGKFVNEKFGATKSMKELATKNQTAFTETETQLQGTLTKYGSKSLTGPKDISFSHIKDLAKEAKKDAAPKEIIDELNYLADKFKTSKALHPTEWNIVKRAMYGEAYTAMGKSKGSAYAKNMRKMAHDIKTIIEEGTEPSVKQLNQLEQQHMALSSAVNKQMNKPASAWGLITKLAPASLIGGGVGGGLVGGGVGALAGMAAQTVPGFTTLGAAGKSLTNPAILAIMESLLPQALVGDEEDKQGE